MRDGGRIELTPATGLALVALFFALGGSAFAVGERVEATLAPQQRCATGAVRAIAVVTGNPREGIANIPGTFTSAPNLFARRFNCTGRGVQVRRVGLGVYEVRFPGIASPSAVADSASPQMSVESLPDGVIRVSMHALGVRDAEDRPFTVVVV
ncbi:MAG: hypothetical protein RMM28_07345 [Thermoleophilia bacterium]|nr:hypothetical protein [Gaiellaceae bacterium]MDW8338934.1 hypothetical protein [Thermoleophilia bacterium]